MEECELLSTRESLRLRNPVSRALAFHLLGLGIISGGRQPTIHSPLLVTNHKLHGLTMENERSGGTRGFNCLRGEEWSTSSCIRTGQVTSDRECFQIPFFLRIVA